MRQVFRLIEPLGPADHVLGPEHAAVTVVEYGDFECPYCKQATGTVKLLLARFGELARFAFRPFPLEEVHPHALQAAEAAECAGSQGKYWQMHELLFDKQPHFELPELYEYASLLGLDVAKFKDEMGTQVHRPRVRENLRTGNASGVRATPTFFVNGELVDVSYGKLALLEAVATQLRLKPTPSPATLP